MESSFYRLKRIEFIHLGVYLNALTPEFIYIQQQKKIFTHGFSFKQMQVIL